MVGRVRRLVQHAIAGIAVSAGMATLGFAVLGSTANGEISIAVPAPLVSIPATPLPKPARSTAPAPARKSPPRSASQVAAGAAVADLASKRDQTLSKQTKSIVSQHKLLKAAAQEAKADRQRALANRGYLPGVTDPREIARQILKNKYDLGDEHYTCFNNIIMRESKWDIDAKNPSSGAYGIPQALPGSKMATVGADWRTNPATQITWAIEYMKKRYGSPCSAWGFKSSHGWY